jgi:hypothetical protein
MKERDQLIGLPGPEPQLEPWMRGIREGIDPVIGHLMRAAEQIREDAASALGDLSSAQIWAKPHGMTSVGFHAKHLAGSTERLSTYLAGRQLTPEQLAAIPTEGEGNETAAELVGRITAALDRYEDMVSSLSRQDFGSIREVGRKRYPVTAISLAIHIAEHGQRHIGGLIGAAKLASTVILRGG